MKTKECLKYMQEEYLKGLYVMHNFLKKEGIVCKKEDGCVECDKFHKFYQKEYKRLIEELKTPHNKSSNKEKK